MIRLQEVGMASVFIDSCQDVFNLMSLLQTFMPLARLALSRSGITDGTQCLPLGQLDWGMTMWWRFNRPNDEECPAATLSSAAMLC